MARGKLDAAVAIDQRHLATDKSTSAPGSLSGERRNRGVRAQVQLLSAEAAMIKGPMGLLMWTTLLLAGCFRGWAKLLLSGAGSMQALNCQTVA